MGTFLTNGYLTFSATEAGGVLTPTGNFGNFNGDLPFFDNDNDGNADSGDYFFFSAYPYSGYTISINGNEYAIVEDNVPGFYFVPYSHALEDLSSLSGTAVTQTITQSGDNTAVANLCFVGGTLISTPTGEQRIEDLSIGDRICTADGRDVAVKWVGRQVMKPAAVNLTVDTKLAPVCIKAGVLGNHSDLYVSADHGMIVDGLVINASALVNGDTIRFVPAAEMPREFTYYHIETEAHDVILANGAPSETFMDAAGRAVFDNYGEYLGLYGTERIIPEMPRPRISTRRLLPDAIKARLGISAIAPEDISLFA